MNKVYEDKWGQTAQVILASKSNEGIPLITFQTHYWRPIHSELKTHRSFSGNSRSSRAVPVTRLLKEPIFLPHFMQNRPGMTSITELPADDLNEANAIWMGMAQGTRDGVKKLHELDVHKQWANRPLEWFGWIDSLYTSTDWANFYALRIDNAAQPELKSLAELMFAAAADVEYQMLNSGEWHLPYINEEDWSVARREAFDDGEENRRSTPYDEWYNIPQKMKEISAARCARVSIKPYEGEADYTSEKLRLKRLLSSPVHASPFEHQATPDKVINWENYDGKNSEEPVWQHPELHGNFDGWIQHRKMIPNEQVRDR